MIPKRVILHHSFTKDSGTVSWNAIRKYHIETKGWADIGYHAGVELVQTADIKSYEVLMGRMWNIQGAHVEGHNSDSLGICFIGNFDIDVPPEKQLAVGAKIVALWMSIFRITRDSIYTHNQFNLDKTCPGLKFPVDHFLELVDTFL